MNRRCVMVSAVVTCAMGTIVGMGVAQLNADVANPVTSPNYAIAGGVIGLLLGAGQEALRQQAEELE
ncbi:hypothetical protein [Geitlerinema sp. PCC 7407]|uniref:hypothetical protein n=1 Tax=Geitlerinema sp. PCC 7407 TaxID=1173025 RepID=UPI00029FCD46|nr:hypothetical protein [Geitlerinema sp. PCC 7407]AFY66606.1 hypothetical protein GEI7407_2126 [Geitlerinema sp. PCC 7407]